MGKIRHQKNKIKPKKEVEVIPDEIEEVCFKFVASNFVLI
jgi:hypothetical protein